MDATDEDVSRMLKKSNSRKPTRSDRFRSGGLYGDAYPPVFNHSPGFGWRGVKGSASWTRGWHTAAEFVWGEPWSEEVLPGSSIQDRVKFISTRKPRDRDIHESDGWIACARYCRHRRSQGASDDILAHDLKAIVTTYWESKKSRRPVVSSTLFRHRLKQGAPDQEAGAGPQAGTPQGPGPRGE